MAESKIWQGSKPAKVLIIGHDPRLNNSHTQAEYCFFADYYFREVPKKKNELAKYELARTVFECISEITNNRYSVSEFIITNLCNTFLPPVKRGTTVFISQKHAEQGIDIIKSLINSNPIEVIFAMSTQVNYWLQKLGFYSQVEPFLKGAEPSRIGLNAYPQFYRAKNSSVFRLICGKCFIIDSGIKLFPIIHVKNWPLKGRFERVYSQSYSSISSSIGM